jgi:hypothetical protein
MPHALARHPRPDICGNPHSLWFRPKLREKYHFADRWPLGEEHNKPVNADPYSSRRRLAKLSADAHEAAGQEDLKALSDMEAGIDLKAGRLWGPNQEELADIRRSLRELCERVSGYYLADRYPPLGNMDLTCEEVARDAEEAKGLILALFPEEPLAR